MIQPQANSNLGQIQAHHAAGMAEAADFFLRSPTFLFEFEIEHSEKCASTFGPDSRTPEVKSFSKFDGQ